MKHIDVDLAHKMGQLLGELNPQEISPTANYLESIRHFIDVGNTKKALKVLNEFRYILKELSEILLFEAVRPGYCTPDVRAN